MRGIVLHTTGGKDKQPQKILPGIGAGRGAAERVARIWAGEDRQAGAHLIVDHDGSILCVADLLLDRALHAGPVNDCTIGIEIFQGPDGELYRDQLARVVQLVDWLTARFGIQRQIPHRYQGPVTRLAAGGRDFVGVYGHRDVTENRGAGDPGDAVFEALSAAGYERRDLEGKDDLRIWRERQVTLNEVARTPLVIDGIPGHRTWRALRAAGLPRGMWITRPGDEAVPDA